MYVNTEKVKRSVFGNGYENRYRISVFLEYKIQSNLYGMEDIQWL